MSTQTAVRAARSFSSEELDSLRHQIQEASEPIAQFWPMKSFVHHNPIHGLEHLPFDTAVREAKGLLGAEGYLANDEYRQLYREGRITEEGVRRAFLRVRRDFDWDAAVDLGSRRICLFDVLRLHLLFGINSLDPRLAAWTFGPAGATKQFPTELAAECRQRILAKADAGTRQAGVGAEESYVAALWASTLSVLGVSDSAGDEHFAADSEAASGVAHSAAPGHRIAVELPPQRTISDWLESLAESTIVESINEQMIKWTAAFVDEGMAGWSMPARRQGFYKCWRELARKDLSGRFLGIQEFQRKLDELPDTPEEAISLSLGRLAIPPDRRTEYLSRHLAHLPGWAGFIRWLGENPEYPAQGRHPIDPVQYLAVRLFYEVELSDKLCRREWGVPATLPALRSYWSERLDEYRALLGRDTPHAGGPTNIQCGDAWRLFRLAQFLELTPREVEGLPPSSVRTLLGWLDEFPEDQHGPVWLEAYEDQYRDRVLTQLIDHRRRAAAPKAERPRAQLVFCIDVRSEPFRRHVEQQGPYETYGFAGFFGVPISHLAFDTSERVPLCPVLLTPKHAVSETPRQDQGEPLAAYASGSRWNRLGSHLFHDLKQNPLGSLMLIDALGFFFSAGLAGKTLVQQPYESVKGALQRWFARPVVTHIPVGNTPSDTGGGAGQNGNNGTSSVALTQGFTTAEQATFVENGLRTMGLTRNLGRFVVLCGHGSVSDNNPYFGALHCGACGGRHGDPNARVFAEMANNPEVRQVLSDRGFAIPEDTWFLAAKHVTTTDRVLFYDVSDVPDSHQQDLRAMQADLEKAGAQQALDRCGYLPRSPKGLSPEKAYRHVITRSMDWANVRPEWGLSGNAGFLVGRRRLTEGLDLKGRVFLHSYDPEADTEGQILEKIMTAPLIVGEWISMEHYFSAVDPWSYGSGSKVIHNVVGGVGVMLGSQSDLQTGLPLQTVNDGAKHYHEPMRLLTIIEAPASRITPIIQKHALLQHLFHNQWVNLIALDPDTFEFQRYNPDGTWETWTPPRN